MNHTSEWDAIAAELQSGRSMRAIAAERRIDRNFVQRVRHSLDLPRRDPSRDNTERDARIAERWNTGDTINAIATEFSLSGSRIAKIVRELGLPSRPSPLGTGPALRVDRGMVEDLLRAGRSAASIAREFSIDKDTVGKIRKAIGLAVYRIPKKLKPARAVKVKAVEVPRIKVAPKPKPARIAAPVPARVVTPPAPVEVRGKPGVWTVPVGRTLEQIEAIAAGMGFSYGGLHDLPWLNKHRVAQGYAPLCVNFPKRDVPLPSRLRSRII